MLKIKSLVKQFGASRAVDSMSLEIREGELVTFLGPSGCGKSTTLRCIAGLESPTDGEIWIDDKVVSAPKRGIDVPPEKRQLGMVFQSYALWPHMTVLENVAYPLKAQKRAPAEVDSRARAALDLVGLTKYGSAKPGNMSGGQQQRVALARALASECRVLLFDEPLSNLDVRLRESMRTEIRDIQQRLGITSIYVTHDQAEALAISDRIVVMNQGRIEQVGGPREIYEQPATPFVATFLGSVNLIPVLSQSFDGDFSTYRMPSGAWVRVSSERRNAIVASPQLGLRAELLRLTRSAEAAEANAWPAVVRRAVFLGDSSEYTLDMSGQEIKARVPAYVRFRAGDSVFVSIAPQDCFIVNGTAATTEPADSAQVAEAA